MPSTTARVRGGRGRAGRPKMQRSSQKTRPLDSRPTGLFTHRSGRRVSPQSLGLRSGEFLSPLRTYTAAFAPGVSQRPGGLPILTSQSALRPSSTISCRVSSCQHSRKICSSSGSSEASGALSALLTLLAQSLSEDLGWGRRLDRTKDTYAFSKTRSSHPPLSHSTA
jgi:hypothetical protein